jgi:hypothetical protein
MKQATVEDIEGRDEMLERLLERRPLGERPAGIDHDRSRARIIASAVILASVSALSCACGGEADVVNAYATPATCEPKEQWRITTPGRRYESALVHNDGYVVVAGPDFFPTPTHVLSLDTLGSTRWEAGLVQRWAKLFASGSSLVVPGIVGDYPDIVTTALSADGAPLWSASIATDHLEEIQTVVADGDSLFLVGESSPTSSFSGEDTQVLVARVGPGGAVEWVRTFGLQKGDGIWSTEKPFGALLDAKGRVVIAAKRWIEGSGGPPWILAVTREGDIAWEHTDNVDYKHESEWNFLPMKDGGSFLTGDVSNGGSSTVTRALRLDAEGALLWSLSLGDGSLNQQVVYAALEGEGSELVLAGFSSSSFAARVWWVSPAGEVIRSIDYPEPGVVFQFLRAMPGGGYLLGWDTTEYLESTTTEAEKELGVWHFLRISSAGDSLWRYDVISDGYTRLSDIVVGPGGEVVASGTWNYHDDPVGWIIAFKEQCVRAQP